MKHPLAQDLNHILDHTEGLWGELRGQRLFMTGGTGFFGTWLLESFAWANDRLDLHASLVVITRDPDAFRVKAPHLAAHHAIRFERGDVRDFTFPAGEFSHAVHAAATSAVDTFRNEDPLVKFDTLVEGTRHTLDFCVMHHVKKMLYTSSGAVYGVPPTDMTHIPEDYRGAPDPADTRAAWGEGKRAAEFFCAYYAQTHGIEMKIARCFSFLGPYLPGDIHYAVGNFIRDALAGGPIRVTGDGTPHRAYLYAADLAIWLWTILFQGQSCFPYNVGSEDSIDMATLAKRVSRCFHPPVAVEIARIPDREQPAGRYVPSTERARIQLGLSQWIELQEGIERSIAFQRNFS